MSCPHGSLPWDGVTGCSICARLALAHAAPEGRCCTEYESGPCPHGWVIEVANPRGYVEPPASNVSVGLRFREADVTIVCDLLWEHGVYMKDSAPLAREIVAALAHAAPEGLCAICKRPFDHKTHQPGIFYHHPFSQPDPTDEAGR